MNSQAPVRGQMLTDPSQGRLARAKGLFFHAMLDKIDQRIAVGVIEAFLPDGTCRLLGGHTPGPLATITVSRWRCLWRLAREGSEGWYQGWARGEWDSEDAVPLFELAMRNRSSFGNTARASAIGRMINRARFWRHRNSRAGSKRNILAHYDLGNDFYRLWLDETMTYSSAIFAEPISGEEKLESAQLRKVQELTERLRLAPGSDVLEIGCGWGYLSRHLAEQGHKVKAITLSPSQRNWAENAASDLANSPDYVIEDYRDLSGQYDAIASVEMVEAVGQSYWPAYLDTLARCLKPGGRAGIQYIAIADDVFEAYASSMDFIQRHIFPGGMLLSESRFRALAEARGLTWEEPKHFGLHYAETLRRWRVRFEAAVEEGGLPAAFDARFIRLWRFYLMYCEGGFRSGGINVAQVTLVKRG
jgi:cyclopropane-fatty-acyl-phospholipid synthase